MRRMPLLLLVLVLGACAGAEGAGDDDATDGRGADAPASRDVPADDATPGATAEADTVQEADGTDGSAEPDDNEPPIDAGEACAAGTIDGAIDCQIAANDAFVNAFCDCFTEGAYAGDRAACVADQPGPTDFQPDACVRQAMEQSAPAAVTNSLCYADAVRELAACVAVCPETEAEFDACFTTVTTRFDDCDARVPAALSQAIDACAGGGTVAPPDDGLPPDDGPTTPPEDADGTALRAQRDAWVATYCTCYGAMEFGDPATCRAQLAAEWDPGLSTCEREAMAAQGEAGATFGACLADTFLIAEVSCLECPMPGSIEQVLCADPGPDVQFCFLEAPPALQDALVGCTR